MTKNKLLEICSEDIFQCLQSISSLTLPDNQKTELVNFRLRHKELMRKMRLDLVSESDGNIERNKLVVSISEFISNLDIIGLLYEEPKTSKRQKEDYQNPVKELEDLLNKNGRTVVKFDSHGNFSFDMGSASKGRILGNLKDVLISIEHLPHKSGNTNVGPAVEIIHFKCLNAENCLKDPAFTKELGSFNHKTIRFENLEIGLKVYEYLIKIQENLNKF